MWIILFNQLYLPCSAPGFHLALALKGTCTCWMFFKPDKTGTAIFMGEAFIYPILMLFHPRAYVIRLPNIECPVALVRNYIEHFMSKYKDVPFGKSPINAKIPKLIPLLFQSFIHKMQRSILAPSFAPIVNALMC